MALRNLEPVEAGLEDEILRVLAPQRPAVASGMEQDSPVFGIFTGQRIEGIGSIRGPLDDTAQLYAEFFQKETRDIKRLGSIKEKRDALWKLEKRLWDQGRLSNPILQTALFNYYRQLGSFVDMKRFYEDNRRRLHPLFLQSDANFADYILAYNRSKQELDKDTADELWKRIRRLEGVLDRKKGDPDEDKLTQVMLTELYVGLGTFHKNRYAAIYDLAVVLENLQEILETRGAAGVGAADVSRFEKKLEIYRSYLPEDEAAGRIDVGEGPRSETVAKDRGLLDELLGSVRRHDPARNLEKALGFYERAYEADLSAYPGINVVRILLYQGKTEEARRFARQVKVAVFQDDTDKSFWAKATLLELALLEGNRQETAAHLAGVLETAAEMNDLGSLVEHLVRWKSLASTVPPLRTELEAVLEVLGAFGAPTKILSLQEIGSRLEKLSLPAASEAGGLVQEMGRYLVSEQERRGSIEGQIERMTLRLAWYRRQIMLGNNVRYNGQVQDVKLDLGERSLARAIVSQLGLVGEADPEKFQQILDGFLERQMVLRNPATGQRDLEEMESPRHKTWIDDYKSKVLQLFGAETSLMSATNLSFSLAAKMGCDCREGNYGKLYLGEEAVSYDLDRDKRAALGLLRQGRISEYEAAMSKLEYKAREKIQNRHLVVLQAGLLGLVQLQRDSGGKKMMYKIKKDGQGFPLFDPDPDAPETKIEEHTLALELVFEEGQAKRRLKEVILRDAWYYGEDGKSYRFHNVTIPREVFQKILDQHPEEPDALIKYGFPVAGALLVSKPGEKEPQPIDIVLRPEGYSFQRHDSLVRRYPADVGVFFARPAAMPPLEAFDLPGLEDQHKKWWETFQAGVLQPILSNPPAAGAEGNPEQWSSEGLVLKFVSTSSDSERFLALQVELSARVLGGKGSPKNQSEAVRELLEQWNNSSVSDERKAMIRGILHLVREPGAMGRLIRTLSEEEDAVSAAALAKILFDLDHSVLPRLFEALAQRAVAQRPGIWQAYFEFSHLLEMHQFEDPQQAYGLFYEQLSRYAGQDSASGVRGEGMEDNREGDVGLRKPFSTIEELFRWVARGYEIGYGVYLPPGRLAAELPEEFVLQFVDEKLHMALYDGKGAWGWRLVPEDKIEQELRDRGILEGKEGKAPFIVVSRGKDLEVMIYRILTSQFAHQHPQRSQQELDLIDDGLGGLSPAQPSEHRTGGDITRHLEWEAKLRSAAARGAKPKALEGGILSPQAALAAGVKFFTHPDILGVLSTVVGDQVTRLSVLFPNSPEVAELRRFNMEPLLIPSALKIPSAAKMPEVLRLLVQPDYEGKIQGQMAGVNVEMVQDPALADFVIGSAEFVRNQRANRAASNALFLQVDDPDFVAGITPLLLAHLIGSRALFPAGTVLRVGALVAGELGEGLLIFA